MKNYELPFFFCCLSYTYLKEGFINIYSYHKKLAKLMIVTVYELNCPQRPNNPYLSSLNVGEVEFVVLCLAHNVVNTY